MGLLEMATPPVSMMSVWRTPHWFCTHNFTFLKFSWKVEILLTYCLSMRWLHQIYKHFWKNYVDSWLRISYKWNFVKNYVQNQWRVLHTYVTDTGGVANSRIPIIRIYFNFENSQLLNRLSVFAQTFTVWCFLFFFIH